VMLWAD